MATCKSIKRLGRPRKEDGEKRTTLVVSLYPSTISQLEEFAAKNFNYNRSTAVESLIICGLREQKDRK